jgi:hypothetical protein
MSARGSARHERHTSPSRGKETFHLSKAPSATLVHVIVIRFLFVSGQDSLRVVGHDRNSRSHHLHPQALRRTPSYW